MMILYCLNPIPLMGIVCQSQGASVFHEGLLSRPAADGSWLLTPWPMARASQFQAGVVQPFN